MRMIMKMSSTVIMGLFLIALASVQAGAGQQAESADKLVGTWKITIDAGEQYFYMTIELKMAEGKLEGVISESMGSFSGVPLSNIKVEGDTLSFEFKSPTPPDGAERLVEAKFTVAGDTLDGMVTVPDLMISARATGSKEKL